MSAERSQKGLLILAGGEKMIFSKNGIETELVTAAAVVILGLVMVGATATFGLALTVLWLLAAITNRLCNAAKARNSPLDGRE